MGCRRCMLEGLVTDKPMPQLPGFLAGVSSHSRMCVQPPGAARPVHSALYNCSVCLLLV